MNIGAMDASTISDENGFEELLDDLELAEPVSEQRQADTPDDGAQDVEEREHRVAHPRGTGGQRRERAHDRHEPRDHDGEWATLFEEGVGLVEVLVLE